MKRLIAAAMVGLFSISSIYALAAEKSGQDQTHAASQVKKHHKKRAHDVKLETRKEQVTTTVAKASTAKPAIPATPAAPAKSEK